MRTFLLSHKKLTVLLCWAQSLVLAVPLPDKNTGPVGLLWIKTKHNGSLYQHAKIERQLTDEIENKLGRRVMKTQPSSMIPMETFRLAKVRKELIKLNQKLSQKSFSDRTLTMTADSEAQALIQEINRRSSQLPRGTFGPEIQLSRLVQAGWFWRKRKIKEFGRLCREAAEVHPLREIDFHRLMDEPLKDVFESECLKKVQINPKNNCELRQIDELFELAYPSWINGFRIATQGREIFPGNYLVIRRGSEGKVFERVIKCGGVIQEEKGKVWAPIGDQVRIENLIPSEFDKAKDLLILAEDSKELGKYHFNSQTGLSDWPLRSEDSAFPNPSSFSTGPEEKWYNKKTVWWFMGAILVTGAILGVRGDSEPQIPFKLKLKNGP